MFETNDLHLLFANIWQELARAVGDRSHPFRLPSVATVTAAGEPAVRTVVLRDVDRSDYRLDFYTDARSPKVRDLRHRARVCWHFWDPVRQIQLRWTGGALLHEEGSSEALERWRNCPLASRLAYAKERASGEEIVDPAEDHLPSAEPAAASEAGRSHFVVVETRIERCDFYHILPNRHRRAQWWIDGGEAVGRWVAW